MNLERLRANLDDVLTRVAEATHRSGRPLGEARLVAVTKRTPSALAEALVGFGQFDLGENYPQELWTKVEELASPAARWHLIGHLQGNKVRRTLPLVRMIHAVDSLKLLRTLDEQARALSDPPSVCLQVNTSSEPSKHGWEPDSILNDADAIAACRSIPIVGLMTMAALGTENDSARPSFWRLRDTRERLQGLTGLNLPELSMGMSGDFEAAIEEGATWVRVGSALFEGVVP